MILGILLLTREETWFIRMLIVNIVQQWRENPNKSHKNKSRHGYVMNMV